MTKKARGYMEKLGGIFKTWKKRYFIIDQGGYLSYYEDERSTSYGDPKGSIPIKQSVIGRVPHEKFKRNFVFSMKPTGQGRTYYMVAPSIESLGFWIEVLLLNGALADHQVKADPVTGITSKLDINSVYEGFVLKFANKIVSEWHRRYAVLTKKQLIWYMEKDRSLKPRNCVPLVGATVRLESPEGNEKKYTFSIRPLSVEKMYYLCPGSKQRLDAWIRALESVQCRVLTKKRASSNFSSSISGASTASDASNRRQSSRENRRESKRGRRATSTRGSPLTSFSCNKKISMSQVILEKGVKLWNDDEDCKYTQLTEQFKLGYLVRTPMRLPGGSILTLEICRQAIIVAVFPEPHRDGLMYQSLTRMGWTDCTGSPTLPKISGASKSLRAVCCKLEKGTFSLPQVAQAADAVMSLFLVGEIEYKAGKKIRRKNSSRTRTKTKEEVDEKPDEKENRSGSLKEKLLKAANGDEEKWRQIKALSGILRKGEISAAEYFVQFLMIFGQKSTLLIFSDIIMAVPSEDTRHELTKEFEKFKNAASKKRESKRSPPPSPSHRPNKSAETGTTGSQPNFQNYETTEDNGEASRETRVSSSPGGYPGSVNKSSEANAKKQDRSGSQDTFSSKVPEDLQSRIQKRMLSIELKKEREQKENEAREDASEAMKAHVKAWAVSHKKNIIQMLVHLDEIFPEGFDDNDPFNLLPSPDVNKVKKAYKKALLRVHPDKVRGLSVPQIVRAEMVFEVVSKAYKKYLKKIQQ